MAGVDTVGDSLFFAAAASASAQVAVQAKKQEKTGGARRTSFRDSLSKSEEERNLTEAGLPPEIAGMDEEQAVVFLKDAADIASDKLKQDPTIQNFSEYRRTVGQFLKYVEQNSYEVIKGHRRPGLNRRGKPFDPPVQIKIINTKLEQLAGDLLYNHADTLKMLARVDEINGMLVDLIAS